MRSSMYDAECLYVTPCRTKSRHVSPGLQVTPIVPLRTMYRLESCHVRRGMLACYVMQDEDSSLPVPLAVYSTQASAQIVRPYMGFRLCLDAAARSAVLGGHTTATLVYTLSRSDPRLALAVGCLPRSTEHRRCHRRPELLQAPSPVHPLPVPAPLTHRDFHIRAERRRGVAPSGRGSQRSRSQVGRNRRRHRDDLGVRWWQRIAIVVRLQRRGGDGRG